ncbi:type II toxin-antitoxin system PrlF family antitoxin [Acetobacter orientalis]|uniref:Transcriptional regulator HtrA suppressor protein SohA n=1 Tax=Acetobacter orientalis TaxID=146474 RepID=A0A0D6NKS5_9PROT|nr:type II toxin-antitoxin system PrlF family antitoxin [Acetobacter orientalis]GAN65971.1 transcriptional regulator HtrA suppressor protein SohA [Acetobacter orientalis]GBR17514.1 putative regulator PrlF [Acetobacter orientalis NRIC 0481]GEL60355.1 regulator PrlF [Acetobacter orientalis]
MPRVVEEVSTLTDRYQTTLPRGVRQYLRIGKRDQIRYVTEHGRVYIEPARVSAPDQALVPFLNLIANDVEANPGRIAALDTGFHQRIAEIVSGVEIDMDAPLSPDDE